MQIRLATVADLTALIELARASSSAAHWSEQQYRQLFAPAEDIPERLALIITAPDVGGDLGSSLLSVCGFLVARHVALEWELENIVVASHARRKGLGRRLLQAFLDHAKTAGSASVFLEVRESSVAARGLYENEGFKPTGHRKSYYANPSEDAVLYRYDFS